MAATTLSIYIGMPHIAVIGAGITGVTTAYALINAGYRVTVIDRHRYPAMETSFANGGQLSASNAEVWNSAATLMKALRWMMRRDAPLLFNPAPRWHKYSWMAEFAGQIRSYRANTIETTRLAIAAREHLFRIADQEQIDFDLERRGILHLYNDKSSFSVAQKANELLKQGGLERYAVTLDEMREIEPALGNRQYFGGFFTPSDSTGDIHKFTRGLALACARKGVEFLFEKTVTSIKRREKDFEIKWSEADHAEPAAWREGGASVDGVVICAGVASRKFATMLGDRVNIYPVKGYSISVYLDDEISKNAAPTVSLLDESAKIVTSRLGRDRFRVAGTAEFNGENRDIRADRIVPLIRWTEKLFPNVNTARVLPWAGLRPMTPSMMPRVGAGKMPGVFFNTGHGHLGWTLACATAEIVTQSVQATLPVSASPLVSTVSGSDAQKSPMAAKPGHMKEGLQQ